MARFLAQGRWAVDGHFRSLAHQENRIANDQFQCAADVTRWPSAVTASPKLSFVALRCQPASGADHMSAGQGIGLALPTPKAAIQFSGILCRPQPQRCLPKRHHPCWKKPYAIRASEWRFPGLSRPWGTAKSLQCRHSGSAAPTTVRT